MLNLTQPIEFDDAEKAHIEALMNERNGDGRLLTGPEMWAKGDANTRRIKGRISEYTLNLQQCRCPYCECLLQQGDAEIEHFAPKSLHREYTFEPYNLTTACGRCNSRKIKGSNDTIIEPQRARYWENQFNIVHPYLCENPDSQIAFEDDDRTKFDFDRCTELGCYTIEFFHWNDYDAFLARQREAPLRHVPLDIAKLVREISTYR